MIRSSHIIALVIAFPLHAQMSASSARRSYEQDLSVAPPSASVTGTPARLFLSGDNANAVASFSAGAELYHEGGLTFNGILGGKVPLQKSADDATFASRDRLADGAEFTLTVHSVFWEPPPSITSPLSLRKWCENNKPEEIPECGEVQLSQLSRAHNQQYKNASGFAQPMMLDIVGKTARATRQFLAGSTMLPDSLDATAWSLGADLARFMSTGLFPAGLISAGGSYAVKYKAGKEGQGCVPVGTGGALQCRTAAIGAPKKKEGFNAHAELRAFLGDHFAINPNYSYVRAGGTHSYAVPLYFIPAQKGGLIGGVEPAWDTDDRRFGLRLFVGSAAFGLGDAR
ncbi:MAG: hypothetical protein JWM95_4265 [Gemmatimonadetes bacterium]|nr:hypothetical protein [Gemmatimonadota bacterium]